MDYVLTFLEGIVSFISPCLLPMVPIYISYFIGEDNNNSKKAITNSIGFVLGFTTVFLILSIFASSLGTVLSSNIKYIKIFFGILIILFGLNYMGILKIGFLNKSKVKNMNTKNFNFFKAIIFGILFALRIEQTAGYAKGYYTNVIIFNWIRNTIYSICNPNRKIKKCF